MKKELLNYLVCPKTKEKLFLEIELIDEKEIIKGKLINSSKTQSYPIINGIPRFVEISNYANNFGMQWNHFKKTQLDSFSGTTISRDRFWKSTGWRQDEIKGKLVLDVGCGSGRFAEIALQSGAIVFALDYSTAVDAIKDNFSEYDNLHLIQGDIYSLPFDVESFDFVYSLGVLQHTPNVEKAFKSLPPIIKFGGKICVDYYEKSFFSMLLPKYWIRPFTKKINQVKLFDFLKSNIILLLSFSRALAKVPLLGKYLKRIVPVANYDGILPLNEFQMQEWALLDTFDALSPQYDNPQTAKTIKKWMIECEIKNVEVFKPVHLCARGIK
jgi:SAM-dependent methyltransferase